MDELTLDEFRQSLDKRRVLSLKIITFALVGGATTFGVIATVIAPEEVKESLSILTAVNLGHAVMMFLMSFIIPNIILKQAKLLENSSVTMSEQILNKIQGAHLVRFALLEGIALFGAVCVLIGAGPINYLSMVPLYLTLISSFPSEKLICRQFIIYFKKDRRLLIEI